MNWRMSVKARHFVTALHDYFIDQLGQSNTSSIGWRAQSDVEGGASATSGNERFGSDDKWCLRYMDPEYVPPIMEAFDDDLSGFVRTLSSKLSF
jgi:hypothetical protein